MTTICPKCGKYKDIDDSLEISPAPGCTCPKKLMLTNALLVNKGKEINNMSVEITHECDKCKNELLRANCWCDDCVDEVKQKSYDEGYADARNEFEQTINTQVETK